MIFTSSIIAETRFSHRPQAGISIGVFVYNDRAYMAAAFRNPSDQFNRRLARQIIAQRIRSGIEGTDRVKYLAWEPLEGQPLLSGGIMHHLRETFKPDVEEADTLFVEVSDFGGVETRNPVDREDAFLQIVAFFKDAVDAAETELCGS